MNPTDNHRFHELKASGDLPSPTGVAFALLQLTLRDDVGISEIADVLRADPALSGRVLKFANAPYHARRRPVVSVPDAIKLVGMHAVRQIVLGLSVMSANRSGACPKFDYVRFWSESLALAVALESLCAHVRGYAPEEAFTLGLLARIGCLALATVYPREYAELLDRPQLCEPSDLLGLERSRFLIDHLDLTTAMLSDWGLPNVHVEAVRGLYDPERVAAQAQRARRLAQLLRLATRMARLCLADPVERAALAPTLAADAAAVELDAEMLAQVFDTAVSAWQGWGAILEVDTEAVPAFAAMMEAARAGCAPSAPEAIGRPPLHALVVDDDPVTLQMLVKLLQNAGHRVTTAVDGREALKLALATGPQIVVTDSVMPNMDGLELCRALRAHNDGRRIYLLVLTGRDDDEHLVEAFEAGADDYLTKPLRPNVLAARLRAGARVIALQAEVEREREENRQHLAELAVANRRLEQAALTDPLTGLPNRRYATRRLDQVWSASRRNDVPLACMLVDIDHFKSINDTHGHVHGDAILCEIAAVLRDTARRDDEVCRIGGEEFLVVCANSDSQAAIATADRLREAVEAHRSQVNGVMHRLTVSIGVAVRNARDTDPDSLMRAADSAVYAAKRLGRNRICTVGTSAEKSTQRAATTGA